MHSLAGYSSSPLSRRTTPPTSGDPNTTSPAGSPDATPSVSSPSATDSASGSGSTTPSAKGGSPDRPQPTPVSPPPSSLSDSQGRAARRESGSRHRTQGRYQASPRPSATTPKATSQVRPTNNSDDLPAATPQAKARQLAQRHDLTAAAQTALSKAFTWIEPQQWNDVANKLVGLARSGKLGPLVSKRHPPKVKMALMQAVTHDPRSADALKQLTQHPRFASQSAKNQTLLVAAVAGGQKRRAMGLLYSNDFQSLDAARKGQALHMLLTSSHFKASRIEGAFEGLQTIQRQFRKLDASDEIGRAMLAHVLTRELKAHPEVFQALGLQARFQVMSVLLGQLGQERMDTHTRRDILQTLQLLKRDNPSITNALIQKTLAAKRNDIPWSSITSNGGAAVLGQMLGSTVASRIPAPLFNQIHGLATTATLNNQSPSHMAAGLIENSAAAMASSALLGAGTVTLGVLAYEGFKGVMHWAGNRAEATHAEAMLRQAGLLSR